MRFLALISLSILSSISFAGEIITDTTRIEALQKNLRENPYYRKLGPAKYEIYSFEIGGATTPFYIENSQTKRFFKKENKCFELTILENRNIARKVRCMDKTKTLHLKGFEDFKAVNKQELLNEVIRGFDTNSFSYSFKLLAYLHEYDDYFMDRAIFGAEVEKLAPKREFNVDLSGITEIKLTEKEFEIKQQLNLKSEKIGILSEKSVLISNNIRLQAGGLIFTNNQGKVLIYNPYLRSPFGTHELIFNQRLPEFLSKLAQDSLNGPVCFRDDLLSPTPKDCQRLVFQTEKLGAYARQRSLKLIL